MAGRRPFSGTAVGRCAVLLVLWAAVTITTTHFALLEHLPLTLTSSELDHWAEAALAASIPLLTKRPTPAPAPKIPRPQKNAGGAASDFLDKLVEAPSRLYHIFQVARPFTGSTLLTNILIGLFEGTDQSYAIGGCGFPKDGVCKWDYKGRGRMSSNTTIVSKTHDFKTFSYKEFYPGMYDRIFFVVSNRGTQRIPNKYCTGAQYMSSVLCLEYDEFAYKNGEEMKKVVALVRKKIQERFPYFSKIVFDEKRAVRRLNDMAEMAAKMKNMSFTNFEYKYGLHGNHTGRNMGKTFSNQQKLKHVLVGKVVKAGQK